MDRALTEEDRQRVLNDEINGRLVTTTGELLARTGDPGQAWALMVKALMWEMGVSAGDPGKMAVEQLAAFCVQVAQQQHSPQANEN